jgi:sulfite reductase (ferredoxin)
MVFIMRSDRSVRCTKRRHVGADRDDLLASEGFDSIPPTTCAGRIRWWGLYTQRKPGIDGGRTASLEPQELDDEYFMLRVRIDGGALDPAPAARHRRHLDEFARDTADISDRQNIQYHWIRVEDVPEIWRRLEAVGLQTTEACGDTPRVILGSPVAGIAADEIIDPHPGHREITEPLPRGPRVLQPAPQVQDRRHRPPEPRRRPRDQRHLLRRRRPPRAGPGLRPLGRRRPVDRARSSPSGWASSSPSRTRPRGLAPRHAIFRDYGYRRLRNKARLKFLVADWGAERFREVLETEYLGRGLPDGPAPEVPADPGDHVGVHPRRTAASTSARLPTVGRVSEADPHRARRPHGGARLGPCAPDPHQKLVVLDVPEAEAWTTSSPASRARPARRPEPVPARDDGLHRHRVLQAGDRRDQGTAPGPSPSSSSGWPMSRSIGPDHPARQRLPQLVRPHPDSRHRPQGPGLTVDGEQVAGFQVHLGGGLAGETARRPDWADRAWPQGHGDRTRRLRRAPHPPFCRCPRAR